MVSAMLTAIQDFVHDSFATPKDDELDTLQVGELTVWIERGPLAVLAAVIRGNAPQDLRLVLQQTLERIHLQFGQAMSRVSGGRIAFRGHCAAPRRLSRGPLRYWTRRNHSSSITPLTVIASLLVIGLLVWGFSGCATSDVGMAMLRDFEMSQALLFRRMAGGEGKRFLSGLRDPLARDPNLVMQEFQIDTNDVVSHWEPFQSLTPKFALSRAGSLLTPPETVKLSVKDGALVAEGFATHNGSQKPARLLVSYLVLQEYTMKICWT